MGYRIILIGLIDLYYSIGDLVVGIIMGFIVVLYTVFIKSC